MSETTKSIRAEIRRCEGVTPVVLRRIEDALAAEPNSPELWVLRGDALQLAEGGTTSLEDARRSYLRAAQIDPSYADAYDSLGHFYFAVIDDAKTAIEYFEAAIARGAGPSAHEGLRKAKEELSELHSDGAA